MAKALGIRVNVPERKQVRLGEEITVTQKQHDDLLHYLKARLDFGNENRDEHINRLEFIDREYYGSLNLDEDDKARMRDNLQAQGVKTTDFILELTSAQLSEFSTYLTTVLAPDEGLYTTTAPRKQQAVANGFTSEMNKHGDKFKHFPQIAKAFIDMGKYNFGGWAPIEWSRIHGNKITRNNNGAVEVQSAVIEEGNKLPAIDVYNFIYDRSVDPTELNSKGEFFIIPEIHTPFRIKRMIANKEIFGEKRFMDSETGNIINTPVGDQMYYRIKPHILISGLFSANPKNDWTNLWGSGGTQATVSDPIEMLHFYIHINPKPFGLSDSDEFQIWRFSTLSDKFIISAEHLNNAHGLLPCAIAMPRYDGFERASKSYAESLAPIQRFASNEMNVHQRSARKALYGLTLYDAQFAPLMEQADLLGGKVPWNPTGIDRDIRKSFMQFNDVPVTDKALQNVEASQQIAQFILPTDTLGQVAGLERATTYQAAATVQASNRRPYKDAKMINTQAFVDAKRIQVYNIMQFQETIIFISDQTGEEEEVSPAQFNELNLDWLIASGLKGIDRLIIVEMLRDIINMLLQSKVGQDRVDVLGILDYWTNLVGEKVDFKSFEFKSPVDALPVEMRNLAFQLLQQSQAAQQNQPGGPQAPGTSNVAQLPAPTAAQGQTGV